MVSYRVRGRVREATLHETDAIGYASVGEFEPGVGTTPVHFRVRLREAGRR